MVQRILELEGDVPGFEPKPGQPVIRHDLIAFLTAVSEHLGDEKAYLHFGVTSYDTEDTATCMLLRASCDLIEKDMQALAQAIRAQIVTHKWTPMIGRTHGVQAEPITFGLKLGVWLAELERDMTRLAQARESVSVGMVSGPVGSYGTVDPRVEEYVCKKLGFEVPKASSQIVQRDRHAHYITTLAIIAGSPGALRHRSPQPPTHRNSRSRRALQEGPARLLLHAPQAQPDDLRDASPASPAWCALTSPPPSKTWPCGTSATSPTPPPSA